MPGKTGGIAHEERSFNVEETTGEKKWVPSITDPLDTHGFIVRGSTAPLASTQAAGDGCRFLGISGSDGLEMGGCVRAQN